MKESHGTLKILLELLSYKNYKWKQGRTL